MIKSFFDLGFYLTENIISLNLYRNHGNLEMTYSPVHSLTQGEIIHYISFFSSSSSSSLFFYLCHISFLMYYGLLLLHNQQTGSNLWGNVEKRLFSGNVA